jgi:hypothetical protein
MFTKEDYNKWLENTKDKELNKKMVEEFPFLLPRNRWTDKVSEDYDYSYNELWALEKGWAKAFGYELICELRDALIEADYLDKYRITQIKEKYGGLRWYDFGAPEKAFEVIRKYTEKSYETCIYCGEPATHETYGWINYVCEKCLNEHKLSGHLIGEDEEDYFEEGED